MQPTDATDSDSTRRSDEPGDPAARRLAQLERAIEERNTELAWTSERLVAELHERSAAQASALAAERYDPATGLPNRRLFEEQLAQSVADHRTAGEPAALLLIGVRELADIRGSNGFRAADLAARAVGDRLRLAVRGCDLVARIGDDEFAVWLTHLRASSDAFVRQFLDAQHDGPVPFHYPAPPLRDDLGLPS